MIRATRVLVAVAFGYLLFGISGEQFMALQESYAWSIGESINTEGNGHALAEAEGNIKQHCQR